MHTENLKELAGEHHKGWMLRFNWTQRRETHQERQQNEGQTKDLARQAERYCIASVSSCREAFFFGKKKPWEKETKMAR